MPEARFCRTCGTPLKQAQSSASGADAPVSPRARTVPLSDEGRTTQGLTGTDDGHLISDTKKVGRKEIEELLRRAGANQEPDGHAKRTNSTTNGSAYTAPNTSLLATTQGTDTGLPSTQAFEATQAFRDSEETEVPQDSEVTHVPAAPSKSAMPEARVVAHKAATQGKAGARARRMWQVAAVALLCVAVVAGLLAFFYYSRGSGVPEDSSGASPISLNDQKKLVDEKLADADRLMREGNTTEAIAQLRYVIKIDPANATAHRRLGEALEKQGDLAQAIEEYRVATAQDPNDAAAGMLYADALVRAGRVEEARAAYQKVLAFASEETAQTARQRLAQLPPPAQTASTNPEANTARNERPGETQNPTAGTETLASNVPPQPTPSVQPTPSSETSSPAAQSGVRQSAQTDPDMYYYEALKIVSGRDPKNLQRAELVRALELFQRAQSGSNGAQAARHADRLGKEYDRRRKQR
jgi:tetratricopeptide (TPR) repeat protein